MTLKSDSHKWDLADDVSPNILQSNPHPDQHGNKNVWHFYKGNWADATKGITSKPTIPAGSDLQFWMLSKSRTQRRKLAKQIENHVMGKSVLASDSPNRGLIEQIQLITDPFENESLHYKLQPDARFTVGPSDRNANFENLYTKPNELVEFKIPRSLITGRTLVCSAEAVAESPKSKSVPFGQTLFVGLSDPKTTKQSVSDVICISEQTVSRQYATNSFSNFRKIFPPALCYHKIVPIDEVVTLTLFHREDDFLKQLFLDQSEANELDTLWEELLFVAKEPLQKQVVLEQLYQFATQDRADLLPGFKDLFEPYRKRAEAFRNRQKLGEPKQLESVIAFAKKAWRRPIKPKETSEITEFYKRLREQELSHEKSIKLTVARILVSPDFLYRRESPHAGSRFSPVSQIELANRLSYFLWSSAPTDDLLRLAENGRLSKSEEVVSTAKQMMTDRKIRRLSVHFVCQWLHVRGFDNDDNKNEQLFPQFAELRNDMYEETVLFFEKMFHENRSVLEIIDSDHTFLNERLAKHYGITSENPTQNWVRVNRLNRNQRGGILGMATFLSSQSGASRTSPILRGNWISETLLGERLPKPPADVPQLPELVPEDLTARELIEKHSSAPQCAKCHARIDPYGFALENFDPIGRLRSKPVDTKTKLIDATEIDGLAGLKNYLLNQRKDDFLRQFCKKLLGFALGRETQLSDELLLIEMISNLKRNDYKVFAAIETILESEQFLNVRDISYSRN